MKSPSFVSSSAVLAIVLPLIFAFTVSLRLNGSTRLGLEYDEMQTVTFAVQDVATLNSLVKEYDVHPPLYYLQLHYWMKGGTGDFWLRANSAFWGGLCGVVLFLFVRHLFDLPVALFAAFLFATNPLAIYYGQSARMYAALMFFGVSAWACCHLIFTHRDWRMSLALVIPGAVSCLGMGYFHGLGFLLLPAVAAYCVLLVLEQPSGWRRLPFCGIMLGLPAAVIYPWLAQAREQSVMHAAKPDLKMIASDLLGLFTGYQGSLPAYFLWMALLAMILGTFFICSQPEAKLRAALFAFVVLPIFMLAALSYEIRPIWLLRSISWLSPFVLVALAWLVLHPLKGLSATMPMLKNLVRWVQYALVMAILFANFGLMQRQTLYLPDYGFREMSVYLKEQCDQDDVVFVPKRYFWGVAWYYAGAGRVIPGRVASIKTEKNGYLVNQLNLQDIQNDVSYWMVSADSAKQSDLKPFDSYIAQGKLVVRESKRFGRLLLLNVVSETKQL